MLGFGDQVWLLLFGGDQILHSPPKGKQNFDSNLRVCKEKKTKFWI
jgi:hypothetical protein